MRTFIGWVLASKDYTDREQVPRNEEPENVDGAVQIRYDIVAKNKEIYVNATTSKKYSLIIDLDFRAKIETHDMIYTDKWYKVNKVEEILPANKEKVVRTWPAQYEKHAIKRVYII